MSNWEWDVKPDLERTKQILEYVDRALETRGSVGLDPQGTVTLAVTCTDILDRWWKAENALAAAQNTLKRHELGGMIPPQSDAANADDPNPVLAPYQYAAKVGLL